MDLSDPYRTPSLVKARNDLKRRIATLKLHYAFNDSFSSLNVWEGEAGLMEHIQLGFPMPLAPRSFVDHHNRQEFSESQDSFTSVNRRNVANRNDLSSKVNDATSGQSLANQAQVRAGNHQITLQLSQKACIIVPNPTVCPLKSAVPTTVTLHQKKTAPNFEPDVIVIDDDETPDIVPNEVRSSQGCGQSSNIQPSAAVTSDLRNLDKCSNFVNDKGFNNTKSSTICKYINSTKDAVLESGISPTCERLHETTRVDLLLSMPHVETRNSIDTEKTLATEIDLAGSLSHTDANHNTKKIYGDSVLNKSFQGITFPQGRQPIADLVLQDGTKAAELYTAKIEEWAACIRHIQNTLNELQESLKSRQKPEAKKQLFVLWREVCFLMECLHVDMELERMALGPQNTGKYFVFPLDLVQAMGKSTALKIFKSFEQMKATLNLMRKDMLKLYRRRQKIFVRYNRSKSAKNVELRIKVPALILLSENNYFFHYQQRQPLILEMTPGLAAGLYGTEKSVLDCYKKWLAQTCPPSKSKRKSSSADNIDNSSSNSLDHLVSSAAAPNQPCSGLQVDDDSSSKKQIDNSGGVTNLNTSSCAPTQVYSTSMNLQATPCSVSPQVDNINTNNCEQTATNLTTGQLSEPDVNVGESETFHSKILEWEVRQKLITDILHFTLPKTKNVKNISDETLRTLSDLRYFIELLYYQMELERIMQNPHSEAKLKKWEFSSLMKAKLGAKGCRSFIKRYGVLLLAQKRFVTAYSKFLKSCRKRVDIFNKTIKRPSKNCLKIKSPNFVCLSKSGLFSKIMKAQTSKKFVKPFCQGLESAFFGTKQNLFQLPSIPEVQPIDLSLCQITKYDESSLKECGMDGHQLHAEFQTTCERWASLASELERSFKKSSGVLSGPQKIPKDTRNICQALKCACSSFQSLCIKFACLRLSVGTSTDVRKIIGEKDSNEISFKFQTLHKTLLQVGNCCHKILFRNRDVIKVYNQKVDKAQQVQLPMLINAVERRIKDHILIGKNSILPVLSPQEMKSNLCTWTAQSFKQIPVAKVKVDLKLSNNNIPSVNSEAAKVQTELLDTTELLAIPGPSGHNSDFNVERYSAMASDSNVNKAGNAKNHPDQKIIGLITSDITVCHCGCDGEVMSNILQCELPGEKPLRERLYLLHFDIRNLKDCLTLAEASLDSSRVPKRTHCKLILDVSATCLYLQTVLIKERDEVYNTGCEDLSILDEKKLGEVGLKRSNIVTIDFQAVEMLMEFLYDHLIRLLEEKLECIVQFFPHAKECALLRIEEKYELSKTVKVKPMC